LTITLQHTATHCTTLHHTAPHCNTLQHTATQEIDIRIELATKAWIERDAQRLQHIATQSNTLQHTATHGNTLQHTATHRNTKAWIERDAQRHNAQDLLVYAERKRTQAKKRDNELAWRHSNQERDTQTHINTHAYTGEEHTGESEMHSIAHTYTGDVDVLPDTPVSLSLSHTHTHLPTTPHDQPAGGAATDVRGR